MCQSKAATGGIGKRCFVHHPGTQASINYVYAKTGIDKKQIYDIMKELRKEGRMLDAPTPEEVEKYFALEEFKTKFDNTLTEKERVTILKQLLAARSEAKTNPVSGGVLHSWKNAMQRTVQRFKRPLIALSLTGTLLFSASACTVGPSDNATATPEETKAPISSSTCVIDNPADLGNIKLGDETSDEYGKYCTVDIADNANTNFITIDAASNPSAIRDAGFSEEDAVKAQQSAYKIAVEQGMDSTRLDNYNTSMSQYFETEASKYVADDAKHFYTDGLAADPNNNLGLTITDSFASPLVRDGGPRVNAVQIKTADLDVVNYEGENYLRVSMNYSGVYRASDDNIIQTIQKFSPDKSVESIKAENPDLGDEDPNSTFVFNANQKLTFGKDDLTKIVGSSIEYSLFTSSASTTITTKK